MLENQTASRTPRHYSPSFPRDCQSATPLTAVCQAFCWNFCKYNWIFVGRNHFNAFDFNFRISNFSFPLLHLHCLLLLLPCLLCLPHCLSLAVTLSLPSPYPVRCYHLCATVVTHFEPTANQYLFMTCCKRNNWNKRLILKNIHRYKQTHWLHIIKFTYHKSNNKYSLWAEFKLGIRFSSARWSVCFFPNKVTK